MTAEPVAEPVTKEQVLREWVHALESGDYFQGQGSLTTTDGELVNYCCLGVLCVIGEQHHLVEPHGAGEYASTELLPLEDEDGDTDLTDTEIPARFAHWLGISQNPELSGTHAIKMNDDLGYSFLLIAAAARKEFGIED